MSLPLWTLEADFDNDGTFSTDLTPWLIRVDDVGLARASALDDFSPRAMKVVLDNDDSRFSPKGTGPYAGKLVQGTRIRLKVQVALPAVTNLLKNPSVETDLTGWTDLFGTAGNMLRNNVVARHGAYAILMQETAAGGYTLASTASLTPAQVDYTGSIWFRAVSQLAGGERIRLKLTETGGAAGDATTTGPYFAVTGVGSVESVWHRAEITRNVVEADRTGLILTVEREDAGHAANQMVAFDSAQVEVGSIATLYCDGDQPGATWDATRHASASSRAANPEFTKFVGDLQDFQPSRDRNRHGRAVFAATGFMSTALRTNISAGPFTRKRAQDVALRVQDVIEATVAKRLLGLEGELFIDPADRNAGNVWVVVSGTLTEAFDTGEAGANPVAFGALEGDNATKWQANGVGNTFEGYINLFGALTVNKNYSFSYWLLGVGGSIGETVRTIVDTDGAGGAVGQDDTVLTALWQRVSIQGLVPSDATFVRFTTTAPGVWGSPADIFLIDGFHASPSLDAAGVAPDITFLGTKWVDEIEYADRYRQSAGGMLRDIAASVGGWIREGGDGGLVFEDYSTRDPAVVSIPVMRLSGSHDLGGVPFKVTSYKQPTTSQAGTVRVGSFGDLVAIPSLDATEHAKAVFNLEGGFLPLTFAANEQRTFFAKHITGGDQQGQLVVRRELAFSLVIGGWTTDGDGIQTPYAISYGRGSDIILKDSGSSAVLHRLLLFGEVLQARSSDRSSVDVGAGDPLVELEMPGQGYKTQQMTDLATWAQAKYNNGPAVLVVTVEGLTPELQLEIFGRDVGVPVWVIHPEGQQGGLGLDHLFYCEGYKFGYEKGQLPKLTMTLEEA